MDLVKLFQIWDKLSAYVTEICHDRNPDHGHEHMQTVAYNTLKILQSENINCQKTWQDAIVVAWLHDVADHKYDHDGKLKENMHQFITKIVDNPTLIIDIIERISYSKEVKIGTDDWETVLGKYGCLIRNIVSDADKLEALGINGFNRCVEYTKYNYIKKFDHEIPRDVLKKNVLDHANEKLLKLKDFYIKTESGKKMAEKLHQELIFCLESPDFRK